MSGEEPSEGDANPGGEEGDPGSEQVGTPRYRWKGLSTVVALFLVLFYPAFLLLQLRGVVASPDGTVSGVLTLAWLSGIGYSVGTDILKEVQEIRGGGQ
ncbi:MAG: hypothetical protein ACNS61_14035 [Candidatus Wenzhouxiangella sp. M2_3B_020]